MKVWKKVQQKQLHFFVRYAIMYHGDEQMSLIQKQTSESVFVLKYKYVPVTENEVNRNINVFGG